MEARGIYASKDTKEAQKFGEGLVATLKEIDGLLKEWEPLVPGSNKALFDAVVKDAAEFKTFRTETVRLGAEVSPTAANAQGNTDANRANRKAFQVSIDALTKRGSEEIDAVEPACGRALRSAPHAARLDCARRHARRASRSAGSSATGRSRGR